MDPLAVLGVDASASAEEIAAAYRSLAKQWHPDHAGDGPEAAARMAQINAAYDEVRDSRLDGGGAGAAPAPAPAVPAVAPRRPRGDWLPEPVRRALGRELLAALADGEQVELVTAVATWKSPRSVLAVTDQRLLWLLDDAISHRVHSLRWRDVVAVEQRVRRPLRRTAVLRVETRLGRRLEWAELTPETARSLAGLVAGRAGLQQPA